MRIASPKTYFKLGVFTILAFVALVAAAFGVGLRSVASETVRYHTYFDESVQGLELGGPVKYRGVNIGSVDAIDIAPDRRHVDVTLALKLSDIRRIGLGTAHAKGIAVPPDLRAQLGSQGITGVKFVNIDFFDPKTNPVPELPFQPAPNTIPAAVSLMKDLEESLAKALDGLPELMRSAVASLGKIDRLMDEVHDERIAHEAGRTLANMNAAVSDLRTVIRHADQARIPEKAAHAIDDMDEAMSKVNAVLDRLGGDGGLMASTQRASDSVGDLGRSVAGSTEELDRTLRDLGDAARAVRDLADAIERDPDMLVKGRAAGGSRRSR